MERAQSGELQALIENIERVIIGKRDVIELLLVAMLCQGHVLLEDVPGTGKTVLARALARSIAGTFRRVQFTPDLLPSDVTGIFFFNQRSGEFEFRPGPIIANIVLADEINRATPRTQSSLLEAMEERSVTVEGTSHPLPRPFMVLATQNPVELEGTFPLPEAQLDRFFVRLHMGYPSAEQEEEIILAQGSGHPLDRVADVVKADDVVRLERQVDDIHVAPDVRQYIVSVVRSTRSHREIELGASPRGSLALYRAAQAYALVSGRPYVLPDDVKLLAVPVLAHRIIPTPDAYLRGRTAVDLVTEIVGSVAVPVEAL